MTFWKPLSMPAFVEHTPSILAAYSYTTFYEIVQFLPCRYDNESGEHAAILLLDDAMCVMCKTHKQQLSSCAGYSRRLLDLVAYIAKKDASA